MKILQVKINGFVSSDAADKISEEIKKGISKGYIVHDEAVELNILEFDEIEVTANGESN